MKKLFTIIAFLYASNAFAIFPVAPLDGDIHWENGVRYVYAAAGNAWINHPIALEAGGDGEIAFWNDTTKQYNFTETTEWVWDDVNKRVGIGIAAPLSPLHINGGVGTLDTGFTVGDGDTGLYESQDDYLMLSAASADVALALNDGAFKQFVISPGTIQDNANNPSLGFGDDDTGFFESADDNLEVTVAGTSRWEWNINSFRGIATNAPQINNATGTTSVPNYTWIADTNTGFSRSALDTISVIAGSDEIGFFTDTVDRQYFQALEAETTRVLFEDEFQGAAPITNSIYWASRTTTGSVAPQSTSNGTVRLTTGATATNEESIDWNDICSFQNTLQPEYRFTVALEQITVIEAEFGLIEVSAGGNDDYIRIYYDTSAGSTWVLETCTGGVCSSDTGAVPDTNSHEFAIIFDSDTEITWLIDGTVQGQVTTNVPTAQLQPYVAVRTEENAAHYMDIHRAIIWQDRS